MKRALIALVALLAGEDDHAQAIDPDGVVAEARRRALALDRDPLPLVLGQVIAPEIGELPAPVAATEQPGETTLAINRPGVVLASSWAIARFWLEAGISTRRCPAWMAFRIRVNISAMGSVMLMLLTPAPGPTSWPW